jgi:hypothetical protein
LQSCKVPNAPCGVERNSGSGGFSHLGTLFLMHRVELKVCLVVGCLTLLLRVPNAPCGVERIRESVECLLELLKVPNAPCGVESDTRRTGRRTLGSRS